MEQYYVLYFFVNLIFLAYVRLGSFKQAYCNLKQPA